MGSREQCIASKRCKENLVSFHCTEVVLCVVSPFVSCVDFYSNARGRNKPIVLLGQDATHSSKLRRTRSTRNIQLTFVPNTDRSRLSSLHVK